MLAQIYGSVLHRTAAIFTIRFMAAVWASPSFGDAAPIGSRELLRRTSFPTSIQSPECQSLFVGQMATNGEVCLSVQDQSLIVDYTSVTDFFYNEVHVWVGVGTPPTTAPGQFIYLRQRILRDRWGWDIGDLHDSFHRSAGREPLQY
jgi:hypothetical protein